MRIGIMGAPVDNSNHGCMALLYSLIHILSEIEKEEQDDYRYVIFDWNYNEEKIVMMSNILDIDRDKVIYAPYVLMLDPLRRLYHIRDYLRMKSEIKKCDCIIDVTEGDSFSDIYGDAWFTGRTRVKLLIENMGIPLILAPQTYGPYLTGKNRSMAAEAIKKARAVMARDKQSQKLVKELAGVDAVYTTDLAFALPCGEYDIKVSDKVKVGINASNLLYFGDEMKDRKFNIKTDYAGYLNGLLDVICGLDRYEVYLISHVDGDYEVHKILKERYPDCNLVPVFKNPVEAKSCISKMDIFIGARMHGTIAAFTCGAACIPTAYSPKFAGLFKSVGYDVLVDLASMDTEDAVDKTRKYIEDYENLTRQAKRCTEDNSEVIRSTYQYLKNYLEVMR